jgi:hypothetical protein
VRLRRNEKKAPAGRFFRPRLPRKKAEQRTRGEPKSVRPAAIKSAISGYIHGSGSLSKSVDRTVPYLFSWRVRTRGDLLSFAIAFALRSARKLVRGLRQELTEEERYRVANDVVDRLKQHGDPWRLSEDLPPPGKGHST